MLACFPVDPSLSLSLWVSLYLGRANRLQEEATRISKLLQSRDAEIEKLRSNLQDEIRKRDETMKQKEEEYKISLNQIRDE